MSPPLSRRGAGTPRLRRRRCRPDAARETLAGSFGAVADVPAYRALFDRAGLDGPGDTLVAGDEQHVVAELRRYADAGVTDLVVSAQGTAAEQDRVLDLVASVRV